MARAFVVAGILSAGLAFGSLASAGLEKGACTDWGPSGWIWGKKV